MRRRWLLAVLLAGCGRLDFDELPRGDAGPNDALDASLDASTGSRYAYLKADNTETFDQFGYALALSADGSTLAVGVPIEDGPGNALAQSGSVFVFARSGDTWIQQGYLRAADAAVDDQFGVSVAISADGNTIAVGAVLEDSASTVINANATDTTAPDAGAVYVFTRSGTTWSQQAYIKALNTESGDSFGWSVALSASGNVLAVGANDEDSSDGNPSDNGALASGAVYTFTRSGTAWGTDAYLKASNTGAGDNFGWTVALSADGATLVVGAPNEDSGATTINGTQTDESVTEGGAVYVLTRGATWTPQAYIKPPTIDFGDFFGRVLALSQDGNTLASSSMGDDSVVANSGAVFMFSRSGTTWTQGPKLKAPNASDNDQFGWALALADNTLLVGAPYEDSSASGIGPVEDTDNRMDSGAVYVFTRNMLTWPFDQYVKDVEPDQNDEYGNALGISQDGVVRAAAAHFEDSAATGINGVATDDTEQDSGSVGIRY